MYQPPTPPGHPQKNWTTRTQGAACPAVLSTKDDHDISDDLCIPSSILSGVRAKHTETSKATVVPSRWGCFHPVVLPPESLCRTDGLRQDAPEACGTAVQSGVSTGSHGRGRARESGDGAGILAFPNSGDGRPRRIVDTTTRYGCTCCCLLLIAQCARCLLLVAQCARVTRRKVRYSPRYDYLCARRLRGVYWLYILMIGIRSGRSWLHNLCIDDPPLPPPQVVLCDPDEHGTTDRLGKKATTKKTPRLGNIDRCPKNIPR